MFLNNGKDIGVNYLSGCINFDMFFCYVERKWREVETVEDLFILNRYV